MDHPRTESVAAATATPPQVPPPTTTTTNNKNNNSTTTTSVNSNSDTTSKSNSNTNTTTNINTSISQKSKNNKTRTNSGSNSSNTTSRHSSINNMKRNSTASRSSSNNSKNNDGNQREEELSMPNLLERSVSPSTSLNNNNNNNNSNNISNTTSTTTTNNITTISSIRINDNDMLSSSSSSSDSLTPTNIDNHDITSIQANNELEDEDDKDIVMTDYTDTLRDNVLNSNKDNNLFKPFDSRTGQFFKNSNSSRTNILNDSNNGSNNITTTTTTTTTNLNFDQMVPPKSITKSMKQNQNNNIKNIPTALRILSNLKSTRSHSVPTILHSSLRRLTTTNVNYYKNNNNNIDNNQIESNGNGTTISTHQMNPYSVMKKKHPKTGHHHHHHHHHHHQHQHNSASNLQALHQDSIGPRSQSPPPHAPSATPSSSSSSSSATPASALGMVSTSNSTTTSSLQNNNNNNNNNSLSSSSLKRAILMANQSFENNNNDIKNINSNNNINLITNQITLQDRINYLKQTQLPIPLPPINLQCLKEIDLQEIVKNPQLRHDIIFDPLLQFRPNLDGERGIKKRNISDKYWNDVENEIIVYFQRPDLFNYNLTRLVPLFDTLRDVLLTIVPQKEYHQIINILDTELNVQELIKGSSQMSTLAEWLANLFKHHCAPMRDSWVDRMSNKFKEAEEEQSLKKLIVGLKLIFQILEAMKLDIANHQIRLLRPALLSNAVEFEKQYFNSLMQTKKMILKSSLTWFDDKFNEYVSNDSSNQLIVKDKNSVTIQETYKISIKSIISLLSCRKMVREYPVSLSFDHARLILLRADIRQLVCLLVCRLLFQQLVANDKTIDQQTKAYINSTYTNKRLKNEIVSIITDEHNNCRWTKNTLSIAVHLCKVINDLTIEFKNKTNLLVNKKDSNENGTNTNNRTAAGLPSLDNNKIAFAKSWLSKQTQPLSEVYGVLETRVFKTLEDGIYEKSECTVDGRVKQDFVYLYSNTTSTTTNTSGTVNMNSSGSSSNTTVPDPVTTNNEKLTPFRAKPNNSNSSSGGGGIFAFTEMEEFENIYRHLYTIIDLHWSVFGSHYIESLGDKIKHTST